MTAIEVGSSTTYPVQIPSTGDPADIQAALKTLVYGTTSTPGSDNAILANSVFGYIRDKLATKANPVFTGGVTIGSSGSNANLTVNGNILVSGTIDTSGGAVTSFLDSVLLVSKDATTDAQITGSGLKAGSGSGAKSILWTSGTGWVASDSISIPTDTTYKINGTTVLTSTTVLGITGTNIALKGSTNTFTASQKIGSGGLVLNTDGSITKSLVNNEWAGPIVMYSPAEPVSYNVSYTDHVGFTYNGFQQTGYNYGYYFWRETVRFVMDPGPLLVGDTFQVSNISGYAGRAFVIDSVQAGVHVIATSIATIYNVLGTFLEDPNMHQPTFSYAGGGGGTILDYYEGAGIQSWRAGSTSVADIDRNGNFTNSGYIESAGYASAASFKDTGKTYHTNSSVPRFDVTATSGNLFSATTAPASPTGWANTTLGNATGATTTKWYALGPVSAASSSFSNMTYATESGYGLVTVAQSGVYQISASLTTSTAIAGTMFGIYVVSADGTKNLPTYMSNLGAINITGNINATIYLNAGEKVGIAVYTSTAAAVTLKSDKSFRFSGYLVG